MKIMRLGCILMLSFLFVAGSGVMASDFRCGSKIIVIGNHKNDVLRRCGEPSNVEVWEQVRNRRDFGTGIWEPEIVLHPHPLLIEEIVTIEEWEYNLGPNTFIRYLRFENGLLKSINEGDYGF